MDTVPDRYIQMTDLIIMSKQLTRAGRDILLRWHHFVLAAIVATCMPATGFAQSDNSDIILFASGEYVERQNLSNDTFNSSDFLPSADMLYTYTNGRWRVLGEYFLTDVESELERLQLGYDLNADTTTWIGRFHRPISAWNFKYHHGAYLQPSITRPAIESWEDDDGVLPAHTTGLMVESGTRRAGGDGFHYAASVGRGPTYLDTELQPYNILNPDEDHGDLAASFALSYYPDYIGTSNFGVLGGYTDIVVLPSTIPGNVAPFNIEQYVLGAQIDWSRDAWQLIAAGYYVDTNPDAGYEAFGGSFFAAYAQLLRGLGDSTDVYARIEGGSNTRTAGYLSLFPEFISQRALIGGRIDIAPRQAFAVELSSVETMQDSFTEISVQWSGVFQ